MSEMPLLQVKNLHTSFFTDAGEVKAVNGISYNLDAGKVLGIVGESGSGKSVSAYSIMRILTDTGRVTGGEVLFKGENILNYAPADAEVPRKQDFHHLPGPHDLPEPDLLDRQPAAGSHPYPYGPEQGTDPGPGG
jgi:ABC-type glutathione transport system ATPase component